MALTVRERLRLQKTVREKSSELEQGGLKVREKLAAQKAMREALELLLVKTDAGGGSPLLADLVAGKFDSLPPLQYIEKLREVVDSIGGDVGPVKQPCISYVEKKIEAGELVLE